MKSKWYCNYSLYGKILHIHIKQKKNLPTISVIDEFTNLHNLRSRSKNWKIFWQTCQNLILFKLNLSGHNFLF